MRAHLFDGTFELYRAFYGAPQSRTSTGREVGATRALIRGFIALLRAGDVTHIGCAFDSVIESFRNQLYAGYKTGEGIDPELFSQFPLAERATAALGIETWPMIDFEADDALATAAASLADRPEVDEVVVCSPDKDLTQMVRGRRVVCWDRIRNTRLDEAGVHEKFGVGPNSIPDFLSLVGDAADGIPGIPRWGRKSAGTILACYEKLERIPAYSGDWRVKIRGAEALSDSLESRRADSELFRMLATLRTDVPIDSSPARLEWKGALRDKLAEICSEIEDDTPLSRVSRFAL